MPRADGSSASASSPRTRPSCRCRRPRPSQLKDPAQFRYIGKGKSASSTCATSRSGKATYGADVRLPGMKYAVIARPPVVGGKLVSFDAKDALAVPGVEQVIEVRGLAVAVEVPAARRRCGYRAQYRCARSRAATRSRSCGTTALTPNTTSTPIARSWRRRRASPASSCATKATPTARLKSADKVITGEYYMPHLAHVSMEPPVATANVTDGKAEVWAPVQSPGGTREDVAKTLDIPTENVTVHVTLLGGGFGRKSKCDYALEAALLSQKLGAPVRVQWTREDDIHHDFYHTVSAERIEAGLDKSGKVVAWRHRSAAPSIVSTFKADTEARDAVRARHGFRGPAVRHPEHPLREPGSCGAHSRSAGSARYPISRTRSRSSAWWPRSRTRPGATRRTCCWS